MEILHELVHKNIIDIYQFYPKDPQYSYMVLEFMAGGELFERIVKKVSSRLLFCVVVVVVVVVLRMLLSLILPWLSKRNSSCCYARA